MFGPETFFAARMRATAVQRLPVALGMPIARRSVVSADPRSVKRFLSALEDRARLDSMRPRGRVTEALLTSKKSLIRFGDGEAAVLTGRRIWQVHQPTEALREELFDLFFGWTQDAPYELAVPHLPFESDDELRARGRNPGLWKSLRGLLCLASCLGQDLTSLLDQLAFRHGDPDSAGEDPRPLWQDSEAVVLVTNGRVARLTRDTRLFGHRRVFLVEAPEREAVKAVSMIVSKVADLFNRHSLPARDVPVVVGSGVAGKLIVGRLMNQHRAYDLGAFLGPKPPEGRRGGAWRPAGESSSGQEP